MLCPYTNKPSTLWAIMQTVACMHLRYALMLNTMLPASFLTAVRVDVRVLTQRLALSPLPAVV